MALVPIVVTARYRESDGDTPASGTVTFRLAEAIRDPDGNIIVVPTNVVATLDDEGDIEVTLFATSNPGATPVGQRYTVTERINLSRKRAYTIELPYTLPGTTFDLADVIV